MNNILHLRYAVEVEKTGSISKAAANLYMGQPHLSKAIRELEESIGIPIFNRTSKGVIATPRGKEFLNHAKSILKQIDEMEALYKPAAKDKQIFDISVPRASYISYAFSEFVREHDLETDMNFNYRETNSVRAIKNVADSVNNLAIVRYQTVYETYFLGALRERELDYEHIWTFHYLVLMSERHPLAGEDEIDVQDLAKYIEIVHGDLSVPSLPVSEARMLAHVNEKKKKISVYERGSQLELLNRIPLTYMWVSPMPQEILTRFSLAEKKCNMAQNQYKDILIYRKGYKRSKEDELFLAKVRETIGKVSGFNR